MRGPSDLPAFVKDLGHHEAHHVVLRLHRQHLVGILHRLDVDANKRSLVQCLTEDRERDDGEDHRHCGEGAKHLHRRHEAEIAEDQRKGDA